MTSLQPQRTTPIRAPHRQARTAHPSPVRTVPVTVIVPAYNEAATLADTILSLRAQTVTPAEIVVVDDGSTDGTAAAVRRYGGPVRYVRQGNQGAAAARNAGLRRCRGDYVGLLDSDDVWAPDKIRHDLATFAADRKSVV